MFIIKTEQLIKKRIRQDNKFIRKHNSQNITVKSVLKLLSRPTLLSDLLKILCPIPERRHQLRLEAILESLQKKNLIEKSNLIYTELDPASGQLIEKQKLGYVKVN